MQSNKYKTLCNPPLTILGIVGTLGNMGAAFLVIVLVGIDGAVEPTKAVLPTQIIFGCLAVCFLAAVLSASSKIFSCVVFTKNTISYQTIFHKKITHQYEYYRYVYHAQYYHGNIAGRGKWVHFIVFSRNMILKENLLKANQLHDSEDLIKIRYNLKKYRKIYAILPSFHQKSLRDAFKNRT